MSGVFQVCLCVIESMCILRVPYCRQTMGEARRELILLLCFFLIFFWQLAPPAKSVPPTRALRGEAAFDLGVEDEVATIARRRMACTHTPTRRPVACGNPLAPATTPMQQAIARSGGRGGPAGKASKNHAGFSSFAVKV